MEQMNNNNTQATVKGYSLCLDVEDKELQLHNRANILANIYEDNKDKRDPSKTSGRGMYNIMSYMDALPLEERGNVLNQFYSVMKQRGYQIAN